MKNLIENKLHTSVDPLISVSYYDNYNDTDEGLFDDEIEWNYVVLQSPSPEIFPSRKTNYNHLFNPLYAF